jgi:hypothetical protein
MSARGNRPKGLESTHKANGAKAIRITAKLSVNLALVLYCKDGSWVSENNSGLKNGRQNMDEDNV